jgi:type IX secretion system PorP/SprF family membrane protein
MQAYAQQMASYTQYVFNYFGLNPAAGGTSGCFELKGGHRRQWLGFESAPVTSFFSLNTNLTNKSKPFQKNKHVVGLYFENDNTGLTGPTARTTFYLNYSYHVSLAQDMYLSAGLFGGMTQYGFTVDEITLSDFNDNAINASRKVILVPDITPGVLLYGKNGFFGYSMRNASGNKLDQVYGFQSRLVRHHYITTGYRIQGRRKEISYLPSANVRLVKGAPFSFDIGLLMDYKGALTFGLIYRKIDAVAAVLQLRYKRLGVGYSYDYNLSRLRIANANSHEVILSYRFCKKNSNGVDDGIRCYAYQ